MNTTFVGQFSVTKVTEEGMNPSATTGTLNYSQLITRAPWRRAKRGMNTTFVG